MAVKTHIIGSGDVATLMNGCATGVTARAIGAGGASASLIGGACPTHATAIGSGLVTAEITDVPSAYEYLRVEPERTMWIDVGLDFDYSVFSNTDWIIN